MNTFILSVKDLKALKTLLLKHNENSFIYAVLIKISSLGDKYPLEESEVKESITLSPLEHKAVQSVLEDVDELPYGVKRDQVEALKELLGFPGVSKEQENELQDINIDNRTSEDS